MAVCINGVELSEAYISEYLRVLTIGYAKCGGEGAMDSLGEGLEEVWIKPEILTREQVAEMVLPHLADALGFPENRDCYETLSYFVKTYLVDQGLPANKARRIVKDHMKAKESEA